MPCRTGGSLAQAGVDRNSGLRDLITQLRGTSEDGVFDGAREKSLCPIPEGRSTADYVSRPNAPFHVVEGSWNPSVAFAL